MTSSSNRGYARVGQCLGLVCLILCLLCNCGGGSDGSVLQNAANPLITPTYDGSGQAMHPSVAYFADSWSGHKYWAVFTPYPNNDAILENPSVLVSENGFSWTVPAGLVNPIAPHVGAHLDDPDIIYDSVSDQLWVYYLEEDTVGKTHVIRRTSIDGVHWSDPRDVFNVPNYRVLSPSVQKIGGMYVMWTVNAGAKGCGAATTVVEYRTSPDGLTWSDPKPVSLTQEGEQIWHIEMRFIESKQEYWAVYAAYPGASCGDTELYFANSKDGIQWRTYPRPLLAKGLDWDHDQIYRSTLLYDADDDTLRIWYSAQRGHVWHTGYTRGKVESLSLY
jgi:hypothetical protein